MSSLCQDCHLSVLHICGFPINDWMREEWQCRKYHRCNFSVRLSGCFYFCLFGGTKWKQRLGASYTVDKYSNIELCPQSSLSVHHQISLCNSTLEILITSFVGDFGSWTRPSLLWVRKDICFFPNHILAFTDPSSRWKLNSLYYHEVSSITDTGKQKRKRACYARK